MSAFFSTTRLNGFHHTMLAHHVMAGDLSSEFSLSLIVCSVKVKELNLDWNLNLSC